MQYDQRMIAYLLFAPLRRDESLLLICDANLAGVFAEQVFGLDIQSINCSTLATYEHRHTNVVFIGPVNPQTDEQLSRVLAPGGTLIKISSQPAPLLPKLIANRLSKRNAEQVHALFAITPNFDKPARMTRLSLRSLFTKTVGNKRPTVKYLASVLFGRRCYLQQDQAHKDPSALEKVIAQVLSLDSNALEANNHLHSAYLSATDILILKLQHHTADYYVRIPLTDAAIERVINNYRICEKLAVEHASVVPKAHKLFSSGVHHASERALSNMLPVDEVKIADAEQAIQLITACVQSISAIHVNHGTEVVIGETHLDRYVRDKANFVCERVSHHFVPAINRVVDYITGELAGSKTLQTLCHGDFKLGNCLKHPRSGQIGIIDWDLAHEDLALFDLVSIVCKTIRDVEAVSMREMIESPSIFARHIVNAYGRLADQCGSDTLSEQTVFLTYWLYMVYKQFRYNGYVNTDWVARNVAWIEPFTAGGNLDSQQTSAN